VLDGPREIETVLAVVREQHGIAFALEAFLQLLGHLALVLDDQDPHRLSVCLASKGA